MSNLWVLLHSPLVSDFTWQHVANLLRRDGLTTFIASLSKYGSHGMPIDLHTCIAENVAYLESHFQRDHAFTLVAHSGAGPLVPSIGLAFPRARYIFVDAGFAAQTTSYLELMKSEDLDWANSFYDYLLKGGYFPNWTMSQLLEIIPDRDTCKLLLDAMRPQGIDYFTTSISVPQDWMNGRQSGYLMLSETYSSYALQAEQLQWPVIRRHRHHFTMITDPLEVKQDLRAIHEQLWKA